MFGVDISLSPPCDYFKKTIKYIFLTTKLENKITIGIVIVQYVTLYMEIIKYDNLIYYVIVYHFQINYFRPNIKKNTKNINKKVYIRTTNKLYTAL